MFFSTGFISFERTRMEFSSYVSSTRREMSMQVAEEAAKGKYCHSQRKCNFYLARGAEHFSNFLFSAPRSYFLYLQTAPKVSLSPFSVYHIIPSLRAINFRPGKLFPAAGNLGPGIVINSNTRERARGQDNLSRRREKFAAS